MKPGFLPATRAKKPLMRSVMQKLVSTMDINKATGLELLQAMAAGVISQPSITQTIPMKMDYFEMGLARFTVKADERHLNPMGGVHGGFAATVLDSVTGCAVHTALDAGVGYGTVDLNIKMIRPVPLKMELIAEGRLINISRSLGVSEGDIKDS